MASASESSPQPVVVHGSILVRTLASEWLGTFALTFVDAAMGIVAAAHPQQGMFLATAVAPGLVVFAMIFAIGELSGAHINPAVTFGFALRGVFPWNRAVLYWICQLAGALVAALVLAALFGLRAAAGASQPLVPVALAFVWETILSFFLVLVILATCHQSKLKGQDAAFAVAATLIFCGLIGKPVSGASMNPARSLGPAIVTGTFSGLWIYLVAPFVGAAFAVAFVRLLHGPPKQKDIDAAQGDHWGRSLRENAPQGPGRPGA